MRKVDVQCVWRCVGALYQVAQVAESAVVDDRLEGARRDAAGCRNKGLGFRVWRFKALPGIEFRTQMQGLGA